MKKVFTLLFILFVIPFYGQWSQQVSGVTATLNDVYCVDEELVFVVGNAGTILKTTDGGANWTQKMANTDSDLTKVQFVNAAVGYIVGANGTLLKTTDSGENWNPIGIGAMTNLYGLSCLSENMFFVSGENGLILKTSDSGVSFSVQDPQVDQTIADIQFLTELTGFAQGVNLLKTSDGGATWSTLSEEYASSFYFLNESTGFVNTMDGGIYKTIDGGANFTYLWTSNMHMEEVSTATENIIWGVENEGLLCGCPTFCIKKVEISDGGVALPYGNCGLSGGFEGIHFITETKGYAVGADGAIFKNSTGTALGNNEFEKIRVSISPNPSTDHVTVSLFDTPELYMVYITDFLGKTIFSEAHVQISITVDTSLLQSGLYFVTIKGDRTRLTEKLIIN